MEIYQATGLFSEQLSQTARQLNVSELRLLNSQLKANGMPTIRPQLRGPSEIQQLQSMGVPQRNAIQLMSVQSNLQVAPVVRQAMDIVGRYESDSVGGYNAVNQIGIKDGRGTLGHSGDIRQMSQHGRSLTDFTVGEIMSLQAGNSMLIKNGLIMEGSTLLDAINLLVLPLRLWFSEWEFLQTLSSRLNSRQNVY